MRATAPIGPAPERLAARLPPKKSQMVQRGLACIALFVALISAGQAASGQFIQQGPKLVGAGAVGGALQGTSVALSADGNTAIVGGPDDNGGIGAVWIFTRIGSIWTQQGAKLVGAGAVGNSMQGTSVALSADGNTAIVGGQGDNSGAGAVWVFTRTGSDWTQQGTKLVGSGAVGNANQGMSVSLSSDGNTAIEGGPDDNYPAGAAWVFTRSGGVWTQQGSKLVGTGVDAGLYNCGAHQGTSVALSADGMTAILGGPDDANKTCVPQGGIGAAWVFIQSAGVWTQQGAKLVNTAVSVEGQGQAVTLSADGNTAVVGAGSCAAKCPSQAGAFIRNGGVWSQQGGALTCPSGPAIGFAGSPPCSAALSGDGNTVVLGGSGANVGPGAASVFTRSASVWSLQTELVGGGATGDFNSESVAISADGNTAIVGGPDNSGAGAAWVFGPYNGAATHDFNGDSRSDVLWRDGSGDVGIWLMNGAQVLQGAIVQQVPGTWSIVGQRDFTGKGNAGILWRDTAGDVGMWLMNGTQLVQGGSFSSVPLNWSIAGTGDFNADGKADILWVDNQGNIGIWFMTGTQILQGGVVGQMPPNWIVVGSDMRGYIVLRNIVTGEVGIWFMNGTQVVQAVDFGVVPLNWSITGIGDFDGNGSTDILWRDTSGDVAIWLMKGTAIMSSATIGNLPMQWSITQTGDYNGDEKSDILWTDTAGDVSVWFMNGTTISSTASYGNVGTSWTVQSLNAE